MSLDFVAAGAVTGGASPTVDIPTADLQANDLLVLTVGSGGGTTTPSGWTLPTGANRGTGSTRITTFYKISDGSEIDFVLGNTNARTQCGVVQYRATGGVPSFVTLAANDGSSTTATTGTQSITTLPALIVSHFCKNPNTDDIGTVANTNQRLLGVSDGNLTNLRVVDEFPAATGTSTARSEAASYDQTWLTNALLFIEPVLLPSADDTVTVTESPTMNLLLMPQAVN